jgi:hypothetical protein
MPWRWRLSLLEVVVVAFVIGLETTALASSAVNQASATVSSMTGDHPATAATGAWEPKDDGFGECNAKATTTDAVQSFPSSSQSSQEEDGKVLEHILGDDYDALDPLVLSRSVRALKERGAHRCWHKHSTFLDHLLGVHHILRLWGQGR